MGGVQRGNRVLSSGLRDDPEGREAGGRREVQEPEGVRIPRADSW